MYQQGRMPKNVFKKSESNAKNISHDSGGARALYHGILYSKIWIMKFLIDIVQNKNEAKVSIENIKYKGFDDLVILFNNSRYCFQFKSQLMVKDIGPNELFPPLFENKQYSIFYYFQEFCKNYSFYADCLTQNQSLSIILFTNRPLYDALYKDQRDEETGNSNLFENCGTVGKDILLEPACVFRMSYQCVQYKRGFFKDIYDKIDVKYIKGTTFDTALNSFINSFFLVTNQPSYPEYNIKDSINEICADRKPYVHEIFNWYFTQIDCWYMKINNTVIDSSELKQYFKNIADIYKGTCLCNSSAEIPVTFE